MPRKFKFAARCKKCWHLLRANSKKGLSTAQSRHQREAHGNGEALARRRQQQKGRMQATRELLQAVEHETALKRNRPAQKTSSHQKVTRSTPEQRLQIRQGDGQKPGRAKAKVAASTTPSARSSKAPGTKRKSGKVKVEKADGQKPGRAKAKVAASTTPSARSSKASGTKRKSGKVNVEKADGRKPGRAKAKVTLHGDGTFSGTRGCWRHFDYRLADPLPVIDDECKLSAPTFSVGTDFSGLNVPVVALKLLGLERFMVEKFVSESNTECQRMLLKHFPKTETYFSDVRLRNLDKVPYVDLYITSFPCQSFSDAGLRRGLLDIRGALMEHSLAYVRKHHPRVFVLENVPGLYFRFRETYDHVINTLATEGYTVVNGGSPLMNTKGHGLPQNRNRVILGAVLTKYYKPDVFHQPQVLDGVVKVGYTFSVGEATCCFCFWSEE